MGVGVRVTLWPLTRRELLGRGHTGAWDVLLDTPPDAWINGLAAPVPPSAEWTETVRIGGYPTPAYELADPDAAGVWFDGYVRTYLERDLQQLASIDGLVDFRRLMRIAALRVGNVAGWCEEGVTQQQVSPRGRPCPKPISWLS